MTIEPFDAIRLINSFLNIEVVVYVGVDKAEGTNPWLFIYYLVCHEININTLYLGYAVWTGIPILFLNWPRGNTQPRNISMIHLNPKFSHDLSSSW